MRVGVPRSCSFERGRAEAWADGSMEVLRSWLQSVAAVDYCLWAAWRPVCSEDQAMGEFNIEG